MSCDCFFRSICPDSCHPYTKTYSISSLVDEYHTAIQNNNYNLHILYHISRIFRKFLVSSSKTSTTIVSQHCFTVYPIRETSKLRNRPFSSVSSFFHINLCLSTFISPHVTAVAIFIATSRTTGARKRIFHAIGIQYFHFDPTRRALAKAFVHISNKMVCGGIKDTQFIHIREFGGESSVHTIVLDI